MASWLKCGAGDLGPRARIGAEAAVQGDLREMEIVPFTLKRMGRLVLRRWEEREGWGRTNLPATAGLETGR